MISEEAILQSKKVNVFMLGLFAGAFLIQWIISFLISLFITNTWVYWGITLVTFLVLVVVVVKFGLEKKLRDENINSESAYVMQGELVGLAVIFMVIAVLYAVLLGLTTINSIDNKTIANNVNIVSPLAKVTGAEIAAGNSIDNVRNHVKVQAVIMTLIYLGVGVILTLYVKDLMGTYMIE